MPSAAKVLRYALVGWGLGHVLLGDRRGWLLLILQPIAILAVAVLAIAFIDELVLELRGERVVVQSDEAAHNE